MRARHDVEGIGGAIDCRGIKKFDGDVAELAVAATGYVDHARCDVAQQHGSGRAHKHGPVSSEAAGPRSEFKDAVARLHTETLEKRFGRRCGEPIDLLDLGIPGLGNLCPLVR